MREEFDVNVRLMTFRGVEERHPNHHPEATPLLMINGNKMERPVLNKLRQQLVVPTIRFNFPPLWFPSFWFPSLDTLFWWQYSAMKDMADAIITIPEARGHGQVDVLGVSMGVPQAIELAVRHPKRVRRLVLVSGTVRPKSLFSLTALHAYFTSTYGGKVRDDPALQELVKTSAGRSPPTTDAYRGFAFFTWLGEQRLKQIQQETLIICGDDDTITPFSEAEFMASLIPNATLVKIEGDGHLAITTSSRRVGQATNQFLLGDIPVAAKSSPLRAAA